MKPHRITYEILRPGLYRAQCRCGKRRVSASPDALSVCGPEHVVTAWEKEHAA